MMLYHGEGFECDHCDRKFHNQKNFKKHLARVKANQDKRNKQIYIFDTETVNLEDGPLSPTSFFKKEDSLQIKLEEPDLRLGKRLFS